MALKSILKPAAIVLSNAGLDPRRLSQLRYLPRYLAQWRRFERMGGAVAHAHPILFDYEEQAGAARGHYFHQDLLVASLIHRSNPARHIDVGSRIDGFVAHVASFRPIEVMDVRALHDTGHRNISFLRADLMDETTVQASAADSVSCLHALEHFGLGRYGDPVDPQGHIKGFNNLLKMLKTGGTLYVSFPIGRTTAVYFNAHRVFHPRDVLSWPHHAQGIELLRFDYVDDGGMLHQDGQIAPSDVRVNYGCGIYTFRKMP